MVEPNGNGIYKLMEKRFGDVDKELTELKDDLANAIRELSVAIIKQSTATESLEKTVATLATQFSTFLTIAANAIPIKAVGWMFLIILVFIGGLKGFEHFDKIIGIF